MNYDEVYLASQPCSGANPGALLVPGIQHSVLLFSGKTVLLCLHAQHGASGHTSSQDTKQA